VDSKDYQKWTLSKDRPGYDGLFQSPKTARLIHAALGISGESGEIVDIVKKHAMYNKEVDLNHLKEEIGDTLYYMAIMLDEMGSSFEEVMKLNHDKLEKRFPTGYTNAAAIARVDKNTK
jgi:NTP pyrophosphatase (non-canonical NTP hydrolase)